MKYYLNSKSVALIPLQFIVNDFGEERLIQLFTSSENGLNEINVLV